MIEITTNMNMFKMKHQCTAFIPWHLNGSVYHIISKFGTNWNKLNILYIQT